MRRIQIVAIITTVILLMMTSCNTTSNFGKRKYTSGNRITKRAYSGYEQEEKQVSLQLEPMKEKSTIQMSKEGVASDVASFDPDSWGVLYWIFVIGATLFLFSWLFG